jgi:monoamine oxidase
MSSPAVVIVGAGAAGIAAARQLRALRVQTLVLEASAHIGGRAVSDNSSFGQPFDRGAHWFHSPAENPLRALADQLRFEYSRSPLAEDYCRVSAPLSTAEALGCAETVERGFDRIAELGARALDVAAELAIERGARWADVVAAEFTAKQGVSPAQGSSLDYSRYVWRDADLPVTGGYGNLISLLAQGLPLELATPVTAIDWGAADGVTVHTARGQIRARAVIVTASTGVLASGVIRFLPALPPATESAIHALPMGHSNKFALSFTRPVFGELPPSLWFPVDAPCVPLELLLRPAGAELAVGIFSGEFGRELAAAGAATMREVLLAQLTGLFGHDIQRAAATSVAVNWDAEPWVRGYVAAAQPGAADARQRLAEPLGERLFFAGEATSRSYMGDVHGAWLSGIAAAKAAAAQCGLIHSSGVADVR